MASYRPISNLSFTKKNFYIGKKLKNFVWPPFLLVARKFGPSFMKSWISHWPRPCMPFVSYVWSHGMLNEDLMTVYQATVVSRLLYSLAWFTNVSQKEHLKSSLRKNIKTGFYSSLSPEFCSHLWINWQQIFGRGGIKRLAHILYCM